MKKSPSFQNVDIFPELDRCTPCVFIGTVARFSRNKSLLISFGAPVVHVKLDKQVADLFLIQTKTYYSSVFNCFMFGQFWIF